MALIVEDGSQVTDSDTYVTRVDYIAYALTLGITVASNANTDTQLVKAAEYIAHHEATLKGYRVDRDQSMAYPRTGLYIEGFYWESDEIPRQVILCQMNFALDVNNGEDLYNRSVNPNIAVTKERVEGAVEIEYANNAQQKLSKTSTGDALLRSLLKNGGLMSIKLIRG
jgi:hypothetical protein